MFRLFVLALVLSFVLAPSARAAATIDSVETAGGALSLADAIALALIKNPELQGFAYEIRAAEARRIQARLKPNPEASLTVENVSGDLPGLSASEATLSLGQLIELGGKRGARVEAARADEAAVWLEYESTKRAVMAEVTRRFVEALGSERLLALQDETVRIAEEVSASVGLKVRAGAVSPVEQTRAELELLNARVRRRDADQEQILSRARLSSLWGEPDPRFAALRGTLDSLSSLPTREALLGRLDQSPLYVRLAAEVEARKARLALARSERIPDLAVEVGYRRLGDSDENTLIGGLSLPLPMSNRNQGGIAEAQADLSRSEVEVGRARVGLALELTEKHNLIARAGARVETFRQQILPTAERAFQEIKTGYERGRFGYVDLLEARRALTDARREELSALAEYQLAVADVELILGAPLNPTPDIEKEKR